MRKIILIEPPKHLLTDVILRVHEEKNLARIRIYFFLFCGLLLSSALGVIAGAASVIQTLIHNGFSELISLVATDSETVLNAWQDFAFSLLETLPVLSLMIVCLLAIVFFSSLRFVTKEYKRVFHYGNLI